MGLGGEGRGGDGLGRARANPRGDGRFPGQCPLLTLAVPSPAEPAGGPSTPLGAQPPDCAGPLLLGLERARPLAVHLVLLSRAGPMSPCPQLTQSIPELAGLAPGSWEVTLSVRRQGEGAGAILSHSSPHIQLVFPSTGLGNPTEQNGGKAATAEKQPLQGSPPRR